MVIEKLEPYASDKQQLKKLSKKKKTEILEVLSGISDIDKDEWKQVLDCIIKFPAELMYDCICKYFDVMGDEYREILYSTITDKCKQGSARTVLYAIIALNISSMSDKAGELLRTLILARWKKTKFDDVMVDAFCSAAEIEGRDFLFAKQNDWDDRVLNTYKELLFSYVAREPSKDHVDMVRSWFNSNNMDIAEADERRLSLPFYEGEQISIVTEESTCANEGEKESKKKDKTMGVEIQKCSTSELLEELMRRVQNFEMDNQRLLSEKNDAMSKYEDVMSQIEYLKSSNSIRETDLKLTTKQLRDERDKNSSLNTEIKQLRQQLSETESKLEKLENEYGILSNQYDNAGQTEMNMFVAEIKRRLSNDHKKFVEIKSNLDADSNFILVDMLDKIFNVLDRNGIKF